MDAKDVKVISVKDAPTVELPKGSWSAMCITKDTVNNPKSMLGYSRFTPGTVCAMMVHETEEMCYVVKGCGTVMVGDQEVKCPTGSAMHIPAGVPHSVVNYSDEDVEMVFVFSYPEYPPTKKVE